MVSSTPVIMMRCRVLSRMTRVPRARKRTKKMLREDPSRWPPCHRQCKCLFSSPMTRKVMVGNRESRPKRNQPYVTSETLKTCKTVLLKIRCIKVRPVHQCVGCRRSLTASPFFPAVATCKREAGSETHHHVRHHAVLRMKFGLPFINSPFACCLSPIAFTNRASRFALRISQQPITHPVSLSILVARQPPISAFCSLLFTFHFHP